MHPRIRQKRHEHQNSMTEKLAVIARFLSNLREFDRIKSDFLNHLITVENSFNAIESTAQSQPLAELISLINGLDCLNEAQDSKEIKLKKQKLTSSLMLKTDMNVLDEYIELINQAHNKLHLINQYSKELNNKVRSVLDKLRRELNQRQPTEKIIECQAAIRSTCIFLTEIDSLNKKVSENNEIKIICPLTHQPIKNKDLITLSNGCHYNKKALRSYGNWHAYHPRTLPGSPFSIDKDDLENIQFTSKKKSLLTILVAGGITSAALGSLFLTSQFIATASIPNIVAITAISIGTTAALGLTVGIFIALLSIPMLIAGVTAFCYLREKYPQELAAYPSLVNNEERIPFSTKEAFDALKINQTPCVKNAEKIKNSESSSPASSPIVFNNEQNYTPANSPSRPSA